MTSKEMKGITIPTTVLESVANGDMSKEEAGEILTIIAKYAIFKEEPEMNTLNYAMKVLWRTLKNELDFNIDKYLKKKEVAIANGRLGGRPRKEEVKIIDLSTSNDIDNTIIQQEEENATEATEIASTEENEEPTIFQRIIEKNSIEELNEKELTFLDIYKSKKSKGESVRFDEFGEYGYSTEEANRLYQSIRGLIIA